MRTPKQLRNLVYVLLIIVQFAGINALAAPSDVEVLISGDRLKQDLDVANKVMRPIGRLKKAGFTVQNRSKNLYHLEYQAVWFDQYMQTVATGTWQRFSLPPNMGKGVVSIGKTPEASVAVFQIRLPYDETIGGESYKKGDLSEGAGAADSSTSDNR